MKFILVIVWILSQKTATVEVEFNDLGACRTAGKLIIEQVHNNAGVNPAAFACVPKGLPENTKAP